MCTGRVDPAFVLRAFSNGIDGIFIGGCWLGECHYLTEGNHDAVTMMHLTRKIMQQIGLNPERLRLEWVSAAEGIRFSEVVTDFTDTLKGLGPLGTGEGMEEGDLKLKLEAAKNIIPYVKLVERERMRVRLESKEEYEEFFASEEADRLFRELIADKLAISQIMQLLRDKPLSSGEISGSLDIDPYEVSRYLNSTTRQGLVRFDESQKRFVHA